MNIPKTPRFDLRALVRKKISSRDVLFLWLVHQGSKTAAELSDQTGTERRLACLSVDNLVSLKYLKKGSSTKDKRINTLSIEKAGISLLESLS